MLELRQARRLPTAACGRANDEYADDHADRAWAADDITWGIFNVPSMIERESGRVMRFPSFVPPDRIIEEYDQVLTEGRPDERWPAS
jgi:hypothetical protein